MAGEPDHHALVPRPDCVDLFIGHVCSVVYALGYVRGLAMQPHIYFTSVCVEL